MNKVAVQHPATTAQPTNLPIHEVVYRQIRDLVLFGELAPGQPVTIQGLVRQLGSGITPVREAIRRLTAERALLATDNRRVSVPELNSRQLEELSFARLSIEPHMARLAMKNLTSADIDMLEAIDQKVDEAIDTGDTQVYLQMNHSFHWTLYRLSNAEILMASAAALWLRVGPSLRVVCGRYGTYNLPDMHEEAIAAMRQADADAVAEAIRKDIEQGHSQIAKDL